MPPNDVATPASPARSPGSPFLTRAIALAVARQQLPIDKSVIPARQVFPPPSVRFLNHLAEHPPALARRNLAGRSLVVFKKHWSLFGGYEQTRPARRVVLSGPIYFPNLPRPH